jgi:hypothetical protein
MGRHLGGGPGGESRACYKGSHELTEQEQALMNAPNWHLEDDHETVTVTFPTNPVVQLKLGVAEVEDALVNLGRLRLMMKPPIGSQFPPGQKVWTVPDPAWATEVDAMTGSTLLHLRDPRYGWLHYLIPGDQARKLGGFLKTRADSPTPEQKGKLN